MGKLRRKNKKGLPRPLTPEEKLALRLCNFSGPWPLPAGWDDERHWQWWQDHRDEMMAACMADAKESDVRVREMGHEPYHSPDWGVPAAAKVFDGWDPPAPAKKKPVEVVQFPKTETEDL